MWSEAPGHRHQFSDVFRGCISLLQRDSETCSDVLRYSELSRYVQRLYISASEMFRNIVCRLHIARPQDRCDVCCSYGTCPHDESDLVDEALGGPPPRCPKDRGGPARRIAVSGSDTCFARSAAARPHTPQDLLCSLPGSQDPSFAAPRATLVCAPADGRCDGGGQVAAVRPGARGRRLCPLHLGRPDRLLALPTPRRRRTSWPPVWLLAAADVSGPPPVWSGTAPR